jgi:hypothetical protein
MPTSPRTCRCTPAASGCFSESQPRLVRDHHVVLLRQRARNHRVVGLLAHDRDHRLGRGAVDDLALCDQLHEPCHLARGGHAQAELLLLFREHVGLAVAEGRPEELGVDEAVGDEALVHVGRAHEGDEEVRGRVVAHRHHEVEQVAHGEDEASVQALQHARAVDLRAVVEGDRVVAPEAAFRDLVEDLDHHPDLDDARGREGRVRVDENGLSGGEVPGRDAHRAVQRAHRVLHSRLQGRRGEGRGDHQDEADEDGERTVGAHAA